MPYNEFICEAEKQDERRCENCGFRRGLMAYIPFNGGMIVCPACCQEWERLEEPKTIEDYAIYNLGSNNNSNQGGER